jgi:hypothetical protein
VTPLRITLLVLLLLAVAGCGSGTAKTVTVTTASTPATTAAPTPADELSAYLVSMKKAEGQWNHAQRAWRKDDPGHYYDNTTPWPAIGRKLVRVREMLDSEVVWLSDVQPPPALVKAHRDWLGSVALTSTLVDNYVTGFKDKDATVVYHLDKNHGRLQLIGTLRTKWRLAVLSVAKQLGVKVPKPLRRVGTGY